MAKRRYSEEVINEAVALYESGESIAEINRTFDLEKTTIYHFLKQRGVPPRNRANGKLPFRPVKRDLVVTTDNQGFVQKVEDHSAVKGPVFEITFTGTLEIPANSIEEALAIARKRVVVSRIYSVKERGFNG